MKAAFIQQPGPPEKIVFGELPQPVPGPGCVLVRVKAVAVNPIDTYIRAGTVKMDLPLPFIVGCDLAGVIEETGPEVSRFRKGDRVWGSNQGLFGRQGTFAEFAAVEDKWLYPIPGDVDETTMAALALVSITAHIGLVQRSRLQPGETVFVNGGTGGVGSSVVQMAKALGARVLTSAGSDEKVSLARSLGADAAFNYRTENLEEKIRSLAPEGIDLWWETVREPDFDRVVRLLAPRGRMVLMAGREARPIFPVGPFYVKGCSLHGFAMFNFTPDEQRHCADDINRWVQEEQLKPRIDRVLPLSEAAEAHRLQEQNTLGNAGVLAGKIVLKPSAA